MTEEEKQKHYEALFDEGRKALWESDREQAKLMGCDECWGWSPEVCGKNCPDYQYDWGEHE